MNYKSLDRALTHSLRLVFTRRQDFSFPEMDGAKPILLRDISGLRPPTRDGSSADAITNASVPFLPPSCGERGGREEKSERLLRCHYRDISAFPVNAIDMCGMYTAIDDTEETRVLGRVSIKRQDGRSIASELTKARRSILLSSVSPPVLSVRVVPRKFVAPPSLPISKTL